MLLITKYYRAPPTALQVTFEDFQVLFTLERDAVKAEQQKDWQFSQSLSPSFSAYTTAIVSPSSTDTPTCKSKRHTILYFLHTNIYLFYLTNICIVFLPWPPFFLLALANLINMCMYVPKELLSYLILI